MRPLRKNLLKQIWRGQKRVLEASLHMLMALRSTEPEVATAHFRKIGIAHGRKMNDITPELYDLWMTCLLETVEECDYRFNKRVEAAWTELLANGINIMKSMY